jgi:hypothetical protein
VLFDRVRSRSPGLSLAETVIAIGVLAVIVLFLIGLIVTSFAVQDKGDENLAAVHLAESEMNLWKSRPYQEVAALAPGPTPAVLKISDGREYRCSLSVAPLASDNPDGRILRLTVRLDWTEATGVGADGVKGQRPAWLELQSILSPGVAL